MKAWLVISRLYFQRRFFAPQAPHLHPVSAHRCQDLELWKALNVGSLEGPPWAS